MQKWLAAPLCHRRRPETQTIARWLQSPADSSLLVVRASALTSELDFGIAFSFEPWALIISLQLGGAFCLTFLGVLLREEFESLWYAILHAIEVSHSPSDNILL